MYDQTSGVLVDGQAKSLFTVNAKGKTSVSTTIDNQTVSIAITADPTLTNETKTINSNSNTLKTSNTTIPMQHRCTNHRIDSRNTHSYWWYNNP